MMECDVCMQQFDSERRRPKFLPCGHSYCLQCLERLPTKTCPVDGKLFELGTLVDNFKLLNTSCTHPKPARFWCIPCEKEATKQCLDTHDVRTLKVQRIKESKPHLEALEQGKAALARLARVLDKKAVDRQMKDCRERLDRELAVLAAVGCSLEDAAGEADAAGWEQAKQAAVRSELSRTAAKLAADLSSPSTLCSLTLRRVAGGAVAWQGEVRPQEDAVAKLLLCQMACQGLLRAPDKQEQRHVGIGEPTPEQSQPTISHVEGSGVDDEQLCPHGTEVSDVVKEVEEDLINMPEDYALAHCVGSDFIMDSGVAVSFRNKFRHVAELLEQNKRPGEVAFLDVNGRYIYYLVTKLGSNDRTTWDGFETAVIEWSKLCVQHNVTKIAIPKLKVDKLDWTRVKYLLYRQFLNCGIEISACVNDQAVRAKGQNVALIHLMDPLSSLDHRECAIVFIASKDLFFNASIRRLSAKYDFASDYSTSSVGLGCIYQYSNPAMKAVVFGLVVKENYYEPISFIAVEKCLRELRRVLNKMKVNYIGLEAFDDPKFEIVTRKLWTLVRDLFFMIHTEVCFCWPDDVKEKNCKERVFDAVKDGIVLKFQIK